MNAPRNGPEADATQTTWRMLLFLAGEEPNSRIARRNLDALCREDLSSRCEVEIVDVLEDFSLAAKHGILVTPALVILEPGPSAMVIGNLNDRRKVRAALRLEKD